jgi:hypothetical protein
MSTFIPKEWEAQQAFIVEAAKAFGAVSRVFSHFRCEPERSDTLDFTAFVDAMQSLCHSQRRDSSGVEDLRVTVSVFDSYRKAVGQRTKLDDHEFKRGLASAQRLRWWLHQTFPDAGPHPEKN